MRKCTVTSPVRPPSSPIPTGPAHDPGRTRLAPSPTGALHLGNVRTFLANWALARARGWTIVLRIEDLDTPRVKPGSIAQCTDLLEWLGIDWDEGPLIQSSHRERFTDAIERLAFEGIAYPAPHTRSELERAESAPHGPAGEARFDPALRPESMPRGFEPCDRPWRFVVEPGPVPFRDRFAGPCAPDPHAEVGDFIVWTRADQPAYQLAVVVDDACQGIDRIVRGDDLIPSTARQILLRRALGLGPEPEYWHLPLVRGPDGRRLAKRHGDTRADSYRTRGVNPERIIGLCGWWCGATDHRTPMDAREFLDAFSPDTMPGDDVIFTAEDDRWLTDG